MRRRNGASPSYNQPTSHRPDLCICIPDNFGGEAYNNYDTVIG